MNPYSFKVILLFLFISFGSQVIAPVTDPDRKDRFGKRSIEKENEGLAEVFKGITFDGNIQEGLSNSSRLVFLLNQSVKQPSPSWNRSMKISKRRQHLT